MAQLMGDPAAAAAPPPQRADRADAQPAARNECVICFEAIMLRCALSPCGHSSLCLACGREQTTCPICRVPVERVLEIFL